MSPTVNWQQYFFSKLTAQILEEGQFLKPQLYLWLTGVLEPVSGLFAGTQHGNLHQSSLTTSRVTYFILRRPRRDSALATLHARKTRGRLKKRKEKKKSNGPGRYKLEKKKFLAVGKARKAVFWLTLGFKGRTFGSSGFPTERTLMSASAEHKRRVQTRRKKSDY